MGHTNICQLVMSPCPILLCQLSLKLPFIYVSHLLIAAWRLYLVFSIPFPSSHNVFDNCHLCFVSLSTSPVALLCIYIAVFPSVSVLASVNVPCDLAASLELLCCLCSWAVFYSDLLIDHNKGIFCIDLCLTFNLHFRSTFCISLHFLKLLSVIWWRVLFIGCI